MNNLKTALLMAGLVALLMAAGQVLGGTSGLLWGSILGLAMNFGMYFYSDRLVLRMYGAQPVSEQDAPALYRMVDRLRQRAGLPMPVVAVAPHEQPNAFATGRSPSRAVVCVTEGILRLLPAEEIEAVIAHELAHIKNRDMLITTIAAGLAGMISNLPWLILFAGGRGDDDRHPLAELVLMVLAPIAAMLIQLAVSRQREFEADRVGAEILGRPRSLASALSRLDAYARRIPMDVAPAAAPLAQVNPLAAHQGAVARLFSTHPPTAERVARLEAMAAGR
ncbi:MAG TPA: zinc metalloprotease HtpX [Gemmatimonadales bacterium]|jgi:heat shock protein HtpX|nr:zinc metalloprotease HtpX [Gemmatimonadales bacterium]